MGLPWILLMASLAMSGYLASTHPGVVGMVQGNQGDDEDVRLEGQAAEAALMTRDGNLNVSAFRRQTDRQTDRQNAEASLL